MKHLKLKFFLDAGSMGQSAYDTNQWVTFKAPLHAKGLRDVKGITDYLVCQDIVYMIYIL